MEGMEDPATPEHLFYPGIGTVTTCWHFLNPDAELDTKSAHKVYLRHNQYTGTWTLFMNGKKVKESTDVSTAGGTFHKIEFQVESSPAEIVIDRSLSSIKFNYSLFVSGQRVNDVSAAAQELTLKDTLPAQVSITSTRTTKDTPKPVTYYLIETTLENGQVARMERRYREFEHTDHLLKSALSGSHLLPSFPDLPGRVLNPFTDQTSDTFIQDRKQGLQLYLQSVAGMSKARTSPDLLVFLGLNPTTGLPLGASNVADSTVESKADT